MAKFINLSKLSRGTCGEDQYVYTETDDGDSEETHCVERTSPTTVNVDSIRCFYPRNNDKPGTRLTFVDGGGFAVSEAYDQVLAAVTSEQLLLTN